MTEPLRNNDDDSLAPRLCDETPPPVPSRPHPDINGKYRRRALSNGMLVLWGFAGIFWALVLMPTVVQFRPWKHWSQKAILAVGVVMVVVGVITHFRDERRRNG